jgi:hypothetical protein
MVVSNVPAGVYRPCAERYFKPDVLKRLDSLVDFQVREPTILRGCRWKICP